MKLLRVAPLTVAAIAVVALTCGIEGWGVRPCLAAPAEATVNANATSVVARFAQAFNKHDLGAIMPLIGDDFIEIFPDGNFIGGKGAEQSTLTTIFIGSPHMTMIMDHLIGDNLTAAAQVSIASEPPKGEPPAAQYAYFFSIIDGKIVAIAVYERGAQAQKEAGAKP